MHTSPGPRLTPDSLLHLFVSRLWRFRYVVLAGGLLGAAIAVLVARSATPEYEAVATVMVRQSSATSPTVATTTMRAVIANHAVAEVVIKRLNLKQTPDGFLRRSLRVEDVPGTYLMRVIVREPDGALAAQSANATAVEAIALNNRLTKTGGDRLQSAMQDELGAARNRMNAAEAAVRDFRLRRTAGRTAGGLHEEEIEGARLHAEYDLASRLYEEIAVQYGKLRLQLADQVADLIVIEEASTPERTVGLSLSANAIFGAVTGLTLALLLAAVVAFLQLPSPEL